jgi:hypothetical protein
MANPEKATEQSSKTKLADLPARKVEPAKAAQVKGGAASDEPESPDARIQKKWLPAN